LHFLQNVVIHEYFFDLLGVKKLGHLATVIYTTKKITVARWPNFWTNISKKAQQNFSWPGKIVGWKMFLWENSHFFRSGRLFCK
jgi:hypothetical protein